MNQGMLSKYALLSLAFVAPACQTEPVDLHDPNQLYDPDRVLDVEIEMAPGDWEALRQQTRLFLDSLARDQCLAQPLASPFTTFNATVTVDGQTLELVTIRKKGFVGSLSTEKPSLKLDFNKLVPGRELGGPGGIEEMVLNNSQQDPSFVRTCLAYELFAEAGIPAPRCNFAHVTVNGEDLGLYVHIEAIDKDFIAKRFADDSGNLYEGTLSDFRPGFLGSFEKETNEDSPDRSDIQALSAALTVDDASLLAALEPVVDLEQYLTYWAMEALTNHWDGYSNNTNNFYVYQDPASARLQFIVYGADGAFLNANPFAAGANAPISVFATGLLPRRLYLLPETQARYIDRLDTLLGSVWNEPAILAEIDRMQALIAPFADRGDGVFVAAVDDVRRFVQGQRQAIEAELASGPVSWTFDLEEPPCLDVLGQITGTFSTTFGTIDDPNFFPGSTATLEAVLNDAPVEYDVVGASAGFDPDAADPASANAMVRLVTTLPDGTVSMVMLSVERSSFEGGTMALDVTPATGFVGFLALDAFIPTGLVSGEVIFEQASLADGAVVSGSFRGEIVELPPLG